MIILRHEGRLRLRASIILILAVAPAFSCREAGERAGAEAGPFAEIRSVLPPPRAGRTPVVLIGIDGGEWSVIRRLWSEGKLPALARLRDEGSHAVLGTAFGSSPEIWTTIATGRTPEVHGITGFVVETPGGTVPVSSSLRRVPALWNMASRAGLRTAVLGWWATWPAEDLAGVVVSDRAHLTDDRIVNPPGFLPAFRSEREEARRRYPLLGGGPLVQDEWMADGATRDRITAQEAQRLAGIGFDLLLVYFRGVDIASHRYWKYLEPEGYDVAPDAMRRFAGVIPSVYEATDQAIGDILAALPEPSNVIVVSDHGFFAGPEERFVNLSADRLLESLGFLARDGETVVFGRSIAYPVESPDHARRKMFRLSLAGREPGGSVAPSEAPGARLRLARALESLTYENGGAVFDVRTAELPPDIDLIAEVNVEDPTLTILSESGPLEGVVLYINRISGTHNATTDGIFIARGPDLLPGIEPEGLTVLDIAPTLLYALGLPVAEDFPGRARTDLFTPAFREGHPVRSVPTWGTMESWKAEASPEDTRLLEELRALGYL